MNRGLIHLLIKSKRHIESGQRDPVNDTPSKEMCKFHCTWDISTNIYNELLLLPQINRISASINKASLRGGAKKIVVNSHLFTLIESFGENYYNRETSMLVGRYNVYVDDNIPDDTIFIYRTQEYRLMPRATNVDQNGIGEIEFLPFERFTADEVFEYKKGLNGYIEVLNYV